MGLIFIIIFLMILLSPGIYFTWELRNDGKFDIREHDGKFELWYCHRVEWMFDSSHDSRTLAVEQIQSYVLRQAGRHLQQEAGINKLVNRR